MRCAGRAQTGCDWAAAAAPGSPHPAPPPRSRLSLPDPQRSKRRSGESQARKPGNEKVLASQAGSWHSKPITASILQKSTTSLGHPEHLSAYPAGACLLIKINGAFGNTDSSLRFYTETSPLFTHTFIFASSVIQYLYWRH